MWLGGFRGLVCSTERGALGLACIGVSEVLMSARGVVFGLSICGKAAVVMMLVVRWTRRECVYRVSLHSWPCGRLGGIMWVNKSDEPS